MAALQEAVRGVGWRERTGKSVLRLGLAATVSGVADGRRIVISPVELTFWLVP